MLVQWLDIKLQVLGAGWSMLRWLGKFGQQLVSNDLGKVVVVLATSKHSKEQLSMEGEATPQVRNRNLD